MKAILVGIGEAGFSWYKRLRNQDMIAAVVETNAAFRSKLGNDAVPFYNSLEEAFANVEADFLVNVTPPMVHSKINNSAFDRNLPVLCEKPISFDWEQSVEIVSRAVRKNIPFMIAENYRRAAPVRQLKQLLEQGLIGRISTIDILFARYHQVKRNYTVRLLEDIGVHHLDMVRYLTGKEGRSIFAQLYNPIGGWEEEGSVQNAQLFLEMDGGIRVNYSGSITSRGTQTPWVGNWRIEGTEGAIEFIDQKIGLTRGGKAERWEDFSDVATTDSLTEFLAALAERRVAETCAADYLNNETIIYFAKTSSALRQSVDIILPNLSASKGV
ncbi:Gfo/Idh/MocA family protein [Paenibacillus cremeus]|uniref:Gfo/Idh/MocA family oxidoreductase n=1 Tax=Paenibacillus cremeus TaxID=2163881 RepID=A0A559K4V4_9BACL|nr:Gfo/Idh/MocA family oxidoreductase [Paenibacillus cremeus]TVY07175.1 Gfo/Idh/MocA family oxidoreductase [Paenibacillus cremeus]